MAEHLFVGNNPPYITIRIKWDASEPELTVQALIDTGFEGFVAMPSLRLPAHIQAIGTRFMELANGTVVEASTYRADVQIENMSDSLPVTIVTGSSDILVGRGLTDHYRVTLDHGRQVTVEP